MQHKIYLSLMLGSLALTVGCSSNPNKAQKLDTKIDSAAPVSGSQKVGLNKNEEMVVQTKTQISEDLRDLQNTVYSLEDRVYGTRKFGSLGLYGDLKACKRKLASRQAGGSGSLTWTEPLDRVTDKEEDLKVGIDEKKDLVGVSEEFLKDRLHRFQGYKQILQKRNDEFEERIEECKAELATKSQDATQSTKVLVTEAPKASLDKSAINAFMCEYVRPGASLQNFMVNVFAHGWLSLSDFKLDQNLIAGPLKDTTAELRDNGFLFNGWKLAYDQNPITINDVLSGTKDAKLVAWTFDHKSDVGQAAACLPSPPGVWNH